MRLQFRIWARKDALNLTSYALSAGIKVLEYFEDYYGIPFPLPKQDMMVRACTHLLQFSSESKFHKIV